MNHNSLSSLSASTSVAISTFYAIPATHLIEASGGTAEVFHQRSLVLFQLDAISQAMEDCRQALKLNEFHYAAMVGLGHCHLELGDLLVLSFGFAEQWKYIRISVSASADPPAREGHPGVVRQPSFLLRMLVVGYQPTVLLELA